MASRPERAKAHSSGGRHDQDEIGIGRQNLAFVERQRQARDHRIGLCHERKQEAASLAGPEIDRDAALAGVQELMKSA